MPELMAKRRVHHETASWLGFINRFANMTRTRIGNGTRLRSVMSIKGDMGILLFSSSSMTWDCATREPEEYLQRRASSKRLIDRPFRRISRVCASMGGRSRDIGKKTDGKSPAQVTGISSYFGRGSIVTPAFIETCAAAWLVLSLGN
jgi:hypothetical protein